MSPHEELSDVTVVGAGPTGLLLALDLSRRGVRPRVLERASAPSSHSKACVIWPRAAELLRAAGVLDTLAREAEPLDAMRIDAYGRPLGRLELRPDPEHPAPGAILVGQECTERVLEAALAEAGIAIERGREVTGLRQTDDEVTVTLAGGEEVRSRYLAGCDGASSTVRTALGIDYEGRTYPTHKLLQVEADMRASFPRVTGEARFWLYDEGFLGYLPMPGGVTRLFGLVPDDDPSDDRDPTLDEMRELVARITGDTNAELSDARWLSYARFQHRCAATFVAGRCALVGDAARIVPPILGQGMNTGLQDAANLAYKLAWVVRGRAPEALLRSYAAEREPIARAVVRRTDVAYRHLSDPGVLQRFVARRAGRVLADREQVQRAAREMLTGLAYRYEDSPAIDPHGSDDALVGARAPDGALVDGALRPTSAHEALEPDAVTALAFCGRRREALAVARELAASAPEHVVVRVVVGWPPEPGEVGADLLVDFDGRLLDGYRAEPGDVVVVRPDGHVGHRGSIHDAARTAAYLDRVLAGSPAGVAG